MTFSFSVWHVSGGNFHFNLNAWSTALSRSIIEEFGTISEDDAVVILRAAVMRSDATCGPFFGGSVGWTITQRLEVE